MSQNDNGIASQVRVTPEQAKRILDAGKLVSNGKVVYVFESEQYEDLEQWGTEEVLHTDIVIHSVHTRQVEGPFGKSYMLFIGRNPGKPEATWLVNVSGVLGQQLQRFINSNAFPLWAHVTERYGKGGTGQHYYTFEPPKVLSDAIEPRPSNNPPETEEVEDLPF